MVHLLKRSVARASPFLFGCCTSSAGGFLSRATERASAPVGFFLLLVGIGNCLLLTIYRTEQAAPVLAVRHNF